MPLFFRRMDRLKPIYDLAYKILFFICKMLLLADIGITCFSVLGRYVPFIPDPAWSEQMVLTLMVYMAVLSATLAIHDGTHIRMTALDKFIPPKVLRVLDVLADIAVMALGVILVVYGNKTLNSPLCKFGKYESIPTLSRYWMYFPLPVSGYAMILFELESLYNHIRGFFIPEEATLPEGGNV